MMVDYFNDVLEETFSMLPVPIDCFLSFATTAENNPSDYCPSPHCETYSWAWNCDSEISDTYISVVSSELESAISARK